MNFEEFINQVSSNIGNFNSKDWKNSNGDKIVFEDFTNNNILKLSNANHRNNNLTISLKKAYRAYENLKLKGLVKRKDLKEFNICNCHVLTWMLLIANSYLGKDFTIKPLSISLLKK